MKKRIVFSLVIVMALMIACTAVHARDRRPGPPEGREGQVLINVKWWKMPGISERLSLTKEEKEKLDTLYFENRSRMIDLKSGIQKERLVLGRLLDSSGFDASAAREQFKKVIETTHQLAMERFGFLLKVREMLGLERFQQLKEEFSSQAGTG